jgi:hypothetical protein
MLETPLQRNLEDAKVSYIEAYRKFREIQKISVAVHTFCKLKPAPHA